MRLVTVAAAILAGSSFSSCLLGRQLDFTEGGLPPLTPPVILDDPGAAPRPNSMVLVELAPGETSRSVQFVVRVLESNPEERAVVKFFVNRKRPCSEASCPRVLSPVMDATPVGDDGVREVRQTITFTPTGQCQWVDVYVSSQFQISMTGEPAVETEPARPGDIAHARWFLWVKPNDSTEEPRWGGCPRSPEHGGAEVF